MKTISASECRLPPDVFNGVVYRGDRVRVQRRDGVCVYIISQQDMDVLTLGLGVEDILKNRAVTDAIGEQIDEI